MGRSKRSKIIVDYFWECKNSFGVSIEENVYFLPYSICEQDSYEDTYFYVPQWLIEKNGLEGYICQ